MQFLLLLISIIVIIITINSFIYYSPKLDLVKEDDKYKLLLWYNSYSNGFITRKWKELFKF